jgi:HlyD family secretion protein
MVDGEKKYIRPGMEVQANVKIDEHRTVWNLMTDEFIGGIEKFKGLK